MAAVLVAKLLLYAVTSYANALFNDVCVYARHSLIHAWQHARAVHLPWHDDAIDLSTIIKFWCFNLNSMNVSGQYIGNDIIHAHFS